MTAAELTPPTSVNRDAAKAVVLNARDHDDARFLLDMLGLVDGPQGREVLPDDPRAGRLPGLGKAPGKNADPPPARRQPDEPQPRNVTTPPGLRLLPPLPVPAKAARKAPKRRSLTADLEELERTDPAVAAAARSYDDMARRVTSRPLPAPATELDAAVARHPAARRRPASDPVVCEAERLVQAGVSPDIAATVAPIGARHRPQSNPQPGQPPAAKEPPTMPSRTPTAVDLDAWFDTGRRSASRPVRNAARDAVMALSQLRYAMDELARVERAAGARQ